MTRDTFVFHFDAGHGWLAVPIGLLDDLGIAGQVSGCSYQDRGVVYLEEDCDASLFERAWVAKHGGHPKYIEVNDGKDSFIRRLPRYTTDLRAMA